MQSASLPIELDSAAALRWGTAGCALRVWVVALVLTVVSLRAVGGAMKNQGGLPDGSAGAWGSGRQRRRKVCGWGAGSCS